MSRVYVLLRRRLLIVAWLITWITTVSFIDVDISDNTDRWSALQSGVHTVVTPDLPGGAVNSPEVGIALINDSSEDEKAKPLYVLYVPYHPPNILLVRWLFDCSRTLHKFSLSQAFPTSRAPPHVAHA